MGRAPAMTREDRRAAILEATLPLLLEHGTAVSTRQIAEAAGVAEGTIFRVFPDKDAVVQAAVEHAFDPGPTDAALDAIDRELPFEDQLVVAVGVLQRRVQDIWRLVSAVGEIRPPGASQELRGLVELLLPRIGELDPAFAARKLRAVTLAMSHPLLYPDAPAPPEEIVALLLRGIWEPAC